MFLSKIYYESEGKTINKESISNVVYALQAKAEFEYVQYTLSLRTAEYQGDIYYDLTDEKHRCIRVSKYGTWEILDETPVPLFRRYNQIPQDLPSTSSFSSDSNL